MTATAASLPAEGTERQPVVTVEHLRKTYGATVAVDDVSFAIHDGEIFGIIGPNGAGKTTIVECLAGLRVPDAGTIRVLGLDPQRDRAALHELLGMQLQQSSLPPRLRVGEVLDLFAAFYPNPLNGEDLLETLGLAGKHHDFVRSLSGGLKQRLSIALALIGRPRIAILDELTTGLDPEARRETWRFIAQVRDRGATVILVTHYLDEVERLCDRVALIDRGRLVALATPPDLAEQAGGGTHLRFVPSAEFPDALLTTLPEVRTLEHQGAAIVVTGTDRVLKAVLFALDRESVELRDVRVTGGTLEDAFVRLTQHENEHEETVRV
ncbi:MAG TPA: ABC transporter ATP-binding protein [Thermomicrobiaceae bacterium]|nr:ABC transporter ATP-binding protein [Thermomicrobiaceae bacterium]